jgi:hypothetical protein
MSMNQEAEKRSSLFLLPESYLLLKGIRNIIDQALNLSLFLKRARLAGETVMAAPKGVFLSLS